MSGRRASAVSCSARMTTCSEIAHRWSREGQVVCGPGLRPSTTDHDRSERSTTSNCSPGPDRRKTSGTGLGYLPFSMTTADHSAAAAIVTAPASGCSSTVAGAGAPGGWRSNSSETRRGSGGGVSEADEHAGQQRGDEAPDAGVEAEQVERGDRRVGADRRPVARRTRGRSRRRRRGRPPSRTPPSIAAIAPAAVARRQKQAIRAGTRKAAAMPALEKTMTSCRNFGGRVATRAATSADGDRRRVARRGDLALGGGRAEEPLVDVADEARGDDEQEAADRAHHRAVGGGHDQAGDVGVRQRAGRAAASPRRASPARAGCRGRR